MNREKWNSQTGFLFAAIGSAIGLGNIWRFSYMTYNYGGGAFIIPYLVALLTVGIPLLILEFGLGHKYTASAPLAYSKVKKNMEWLGWWSVMFMMFGVLLYYMVIVAWCINFFFLSFNLGWGDEPDGFFFKQFLCVTDSPFKIGSIRPQIFWALAVGWFINWAIVYRGIQKGIELANKIFMPLLFILTTILVFWAISLEGSFVGLSAYLKPDFSQITKPQVWIDAYSQIFFTLSLGFGVMIAYASYLPEKADITKNALITVIINSGYSLFAGVAVFAVLGFMATTQSKPVSEVVSQSIGLAFVAYPKALSLMPLGNIFGVLFFLCLIVAGLSSSVSIIEAFAASQIDKFGFKRKYLVTILSIAGFSGSIIFSTQAGLLWLDIVDHFITHYGLVMIGIIEAIIVGWFFQIKIISDHINRISSIKLGWWWNILIKFFIPVILGIILISDIYAEIQKPYGDYSWSSLILIGVNWMILTAIAAFILTSLKCRTDNNAGEDKNE